MDRGFGPATWTAKVQLSHAGRVSYIMTERSKFRPERNNAGRWFAAVTTGKGPISHVGDFATQQEASEWISTKSKDWPHSGGSQDAETE